MLEYNKSQIRSNEKIKTVICVDCSKAFRVPLAYHVKEPRCESCKINHRKEKDKEWRIRVNKEHKESKEQFFEGPFTCHNCGKIFYEDWRDYESRKKSPPKYCGKKCQTSFASSQRPQSSYKGKCVDCGKEIIISSFDSRKEHRCAICAKKRTAKKEKINKSLRKQEIAKSINESEKVNDLYYI